MSGDLLPLDLPAVTKQTAAIVNLPVLVCGCGNPEWMAVRPGTASTAERYSHSNIVEFRADDGEPTEVWCEACWSKRFGVRP